ncbi:hypothetical protein RJ639_006750 [Escallonia herrerae]|uniref:Uncharacterized protein n=1 Tax=Escallonia herrerae TaxID=1293975 RepID=A0AA88W3W2_9ASTE|nr:hypothetical protein RJ639_006750 [Escallonia herrerae]
MTINNNVHKEKEDASNYVQDEKERVGDGVEGDGLGSSRGDEPRIDSIEDIKDESRQAVQGQGVVQLPQQQLQGSLVHWETFLNVRSIRVLLVENDDSTRHIVTALLRNSNYEAQCMKLSEVHVLWRGEGMQPCSCYHREDILRSGFLRNLRIAAETRARNCMFELLYLNG